MTLLEFSELQDTNWEVEEYVKKFLKKEPRFANATYLRDKMEVDNFNYIYDYNHHWMVELNGKTYNMLISTGNTWYGSRSIPGVKFKRVYREGEEPIVRRRKSNCDYNFEVPWKSVVRGSGVGKRNDCQIWTLAKSLGITYTEAFDVLYAKGWREDKAGNEWKNDWSGIFDSYGKVLSDYWSKWQNNKLFKGSTVGNIVNKLPSTGTFVVGVRGHILCVVDGVIYDSSFSPGNRVRRIYKVEDKINC